MAAPKKVADKVKRRVMRRLKRQQLPLSHLPKALPESRQENNPECSVQDV